jgi:hypothetical protein
VADTGNNRVQILTSDGDYLNEFVMPTATQLPRGIAIDKNLVAYVSQINGNKVTRWKLTNSRPILSLAGSRNRRTTAARATLRGTAADDGEVSAVQFKVGSGRYRNASTAWKAVVPLQRGRNVIRIRAKDNFGLYSAPLSLTVTRR